MNNKDEAKDIFKKETEHDSSNTNSMHTNTKHTSETQAHRTDMQTHTPPQNLDINNIYAKYNDLYLHLDKLIWSSLAGVTATIFAVLTILTTTACNDDLRRFFPYLLLISLIFVALIVKSYNNTMSKFKDGRDFVSEVLRNIELNSCHFKHPILSGTSSTEKACVSFFDRRVKSIIDNQNKSNRMIDRLLSVTYSLYIFILFTLAADIIYIINTFLSRHIDVYTHIIDILTHAFHHNP